MADRDESGWHRKARRPTRDVIARRTIKVRFTEEEEATIRESLRPGEKLSVFLRALALGIYEEEQTPHGTRREGSAEGEEEPTGG